MIEYNLMQLLREQDQFDMTFSINSSNIKDNIVSIYSTGGSPPSTYEGRLGTPRYQIVVKSSDFDLAKEKAYDIIELLHGLQSLVMSVELKTKSIPIKVMQIRALHEPALLGVNEDDIMEYSINFETQLIPLKGHQT